MTTPASRQEVRGQLNESLLRPGLPRCQDGAMARAAIAAHRASMEPVPLKSVRTSLKVWEMLLSHLSSLPSATTSLTLLVSPSRVLTCSTLGLAMPALSGGHFC